MDICKKSITGIDSFNYLSRNKKDPGFGIPLCIKEMKSHVKPSYGVTAADALEFCVAIGFLITSFLTHLSPFITREPVHTLICFYNTFYFGKIVIIY